jgi:hypothetical protein
MAMAFVVVIYGTPVVTGVTDPKDLMGSWSENKLTNKQLNKQTNKQTNKQIIHLKLYEQIKFIQCRPHRSWCAW